MSATAEIAFEGRKPIKQGFEHNGRVFLVRDRDFIEVKSKTDYVEIPPSHLADSIEAMGWWEGRLTTFGNGISWIDVSTQPAVRSTIAQGFWGTTGIVLDQKEVLAGGGGWPAFQLNSPTSSNGTLIMHNPQSTYDHIDDFDASDGIVWIASHLTNEGTIWDGKAIIRGYPGGDSYILPETRWHDFAAVGGRLSTAVSRTIARRPTPWMWA